MQLLELELHVMGFLIFTQLTGNWRIKKTLARSQHIRFQWGRAWIQMNGKMWCFFDKQLVDPSVSISGCTVESLCSSSLQLLAFHLANEPENWLEREEWNNFNLPLETWCGLSSFLKLWTLYKNLKLNLPSSFNSFQHPAPTAATTPPPPPRVAKQPIVFLCWSTNSEQDICF